MHKYTKFCYSSFDISTFGFKAPPYCRYVCVGRDYDDGNDDGDGSGGDDDDEDDENFPEKVQSQEWRVEKFQCDPLTNSYQMIIFI